MRMIKFLTLSEVLLILDDQIKNYGGKYGIRDINHADYRSRTGFILPILIIPSISAGSGYVHTGTNAKGAGIEFSGHTKIPLLYADVCPSFHFFSKGSQIFVPKSIRRP